jgi:hypothetical protein
MLPTQKEAWGKSVSPEVTIQKTPQRTLSGRNRESVNDGLGIEFDFCSLAMAILSRRPGSPGA